MDSSYTPVQYVYREVIEEEIAKHSSGKIFFFSADEKVDDREGKIVKLVEIESKGLYIVMNPEYQIRIDRIITIFGKPGPAYDEYGSYANQCLSCTGGYDL